MPVDRLFRSDRVSAIAHRGGAGLRPENTIAAFDHAAALGVDGLECDVHLSRDGVPVVFHDDTLDRTTDGRGPVAAQDTGALARLDAGYHFASDGAFPFRGRDVRIPTLADLLDRYPDLPVIVEVKGDRAEVTEPILRVVRAGRRPDRVVIGGFSDAVLEAVRRQAPGILTGASREEVENAGRRIAAGLAPARTGYALFQIPYFFRGQQVLTEPFARAVTGAGIPLQSWVIDSEEDMRMLMDWGVTGLISDRPDVAVRVLHRSSRT